MVVLRVCRPQHLQFSRGRRGKPAVAGPQEVLQGSHLHFNLSHTHGLLGEWPRR
jgi:phosphopantetheinyl transferase